SVNSANAPLACASATMTALRLTVSTPRNARCTMTSDAIATASPTSVSMSEAPRTLGSGMRQHRGDGRAMRNGLARQLPLHGDPDAPPFGGVVDRDPRRVRLGADPGQPHRPRENAPVSVAVGGSVIAGGKRCRCLGRHAA